MTRIHLMLAIQRAKADGFHNFAAALAELLKSELENNGK